ncbi:uncharacterized protein [Pocillopora verrucosa]|uniref:uncharacterized protein n=1 Tax=Pocillopora verrucosa TaxID=203993 RepID=UPI003341A1CA
MMISAIQQWRTISLNLFLFVIGGGAGYPSGIEFKNASICDGFHDHTAKIKISPWPFIATGTIATVSVTLTPAVDVLDAYSNYIIKSESDGKVILKERENVCKKADFQELCSLPADETHVFTYSYKLTAIPSFFKMLTVNGRWQLFNQDGIMFFCLDAVAKGH